MVVHGDDFISEGSRADLKWLDSAMKEHFELKTEVLGPQKALGEVQEARVLNRVLKWESTGISWEPDPRHAELVIQQLGLQGGKPVTTPGSKEAAKRQSVTEEEGEE